MAIFSIPFPISVTAAACVALVVAGCTTTGNRSGKEASPMFNALRVTEHRDSDDLLTAGLGRDGLRAMLAPAFADAEHPTAVELRRRALWNNWRGIADLAPGGGYGDVYGSTANVPGREFTALATVPGASQPHRVMAQVPDAFDTARRCVVVTASSGSRGIYGSIAVAGAWGLPKGCAVAYTDKGAGTDYFDLDAGQGVRADGTLGARGDSLAFVPDTTATSGVAFKHAHSRDNPEADWGRHVKQAAQFALHSLDSAFPHAAPFTFDNTRVIAVGISNGGGAVLRAAELDGSGPDAGWLDAVVAGEPNVTVAEARPLYD
ncbi:MAG: 3-hydroxybutyrate oligomer hydrolase family protein, partial [Lysobacter sp.]